MEVLLGVLCGLHRGARLSKTMHRVQPRWLLWTKTVAACPQKPRLPHCLECWSSGPLPQACPPPRDARGSHPP